LLGAEKLTEKILEEARQQAQKDVDQAKREAADMLKGARKEAEQRHKSILDKAQREAAERKRRLIAYAELDARKQRLKTKQDMLEDAFRKAIESLNSMPVEKYRDMLVDMVARAVRKGDEEIILSERDRKRLGDDFAGLVNERLKNNSLKARIVLSDETRDISGGFILRSGNVEMNNSFETIIRMVRDELEADVAKALFGEGS